MTLSEYAQGRVVLLTGSTGFLGSVILEKLLWSLPGIKKIILFVRPKKGEQSDVRFMKMLSTKPSFERLRSRHGKNLEEFVRSKVQLIEADLLQENLGLSPESEQTILDEVNVFICCAASVDFRAELMKNLKVNLEGTLRLFELAKRTKNVTNFLQVSTCYVNSDKSGYIKEIIYDYSDDPEATIQSIMKKPPEVVEQETPQILGTATTPSRLPPARTPNQLRGGALLLAAATSCFLAPLLCVQASSRTRTCTRRTTASGFCRSGGRRA